MSSCVLIRGALPLAVGMLLVCGAPAVAAPQLCDNVNPRGIVPTHLFAKIDGAWVEPSGLCVAPGVDETTAADGTIGRTLNLHVFSGNGVVGGFPETTLPVGTVISVGLQLPSDMSLVTINGRWRNGVVVTNGSEVVMQAQTVPWDYHQEAYFGSGLDCSLPPAVFPSTFSAWASLNSLNADRTPSTREAPYAGGYYENNAVIAGFPLFSADATGVPTGVVVGVSGCGDADPATHEGYFDGFTPVSVLRAFGIDESLLSDPSLLQSLLEVHDNITNASVDATFTPVYQQDIKLDPVPGVVMPQIPAGDALAGVRMTSSFSYSDHVLVQRAEPASLQKLRDCRTQGGTPVAQSGQVACTGIPASGGPPFAAKLHTARALRAGGAVSVSCNQPCAVSVRVTARGRRIAKGRGDTKKAGTVKVRLRLTKVGRRLLASRTSLSATLRAIVTGPSGAPVHIKRRITLKR